MRFCLFLFDHTARFFTFSTLNSFSSQRKKLINVNVHHHPQLSKKNSLSSKASQVANSAPLDLHQHQSQQQNTPLVPRQKIRVISNWLRAAALRTPSESNPTQPPESKWRHTLPSIASFRRTTTQHGTARTTEEATDDGRSVSNVTCCVLERGHTTRVIGK